MNRIAVAQELVKLAKELMASGSYTKLRDGSWGIRVDGHARVGEMVEVTTKGGQRKREKVTKVLWTGQDKFSGKTISLCSIEQRASSSPASSPSRDRRFPGWDGKIGSPSYYSSGAFDEYDM
jgi:hypothetical protein